MTQGSISSDTVSTVVRMINIALIAAFFCVGAGVFHGRVHETTGSETTGSQVSNEIVARSIGG